MPGLSAQFPSAVGRRFVKTGHPMPRRAAGCDFRSPAWLGRHALLHLHGEYSFACLAWTLGPDKDVGILLARGCGPSSLPWSFRGHSVPDSSSGQGLRCPRGVFFKCYAVEEERRKIWLSISKEKHKAQRAWGKGTKRTLHPARRRSWNMARRFGKLHWQSRRNK